MFLTSASLSNLHLYSCDITENIKTTNCCLECRSGLGLELHWIYFSWTTEWAPLCLSITSPWNAVWQQR